MSGLGNCIFGERMGSGMIIVKSVVEELKEGNTLKLSRSSEFQNKKQTNTKNQNVGDMIWHFGTCFFSAVSLTWFCFTFLRLQTHSIFTHKLSWLIWLCQSCLFLTLGIAELLIIHSQVFQFLFTFPDIPLAPLPENHLSHLSLLAAVQDSPAQQRRSCRLLHSLLDNLEWRFISQEWIQNLQ